jgi:hypothetical protein
MDARTRLGWIGRDEEVGNAGLPRPPAMRHRPPELAQGVAALPYQPEGTAGLEPPSATGRTAHPAGRKVFAEQEARILRRRRERELGTKRLCNELARRHGLRPALDTIPKVLVRHGEARTG